MKIVPAEETISGLKKQASEYELSAQKADEPEKSKLKDLAERCKEWSASLRTGAWIS